MPQVGASPAATAVSREFGAEEVAAGSDAALESNSTYGSESDSLPGSGTKATAEATEQEDTREPVLLMQLLLSLVASLEGADQQLLGAATNALQTDIGLSLMDISYCTMMQLVFTNLAAPFWGILADRGILRRRTILVIGALGQGTVIAILALVSSAVPIILLRGLNGFLLAALRPISNGIIADMTGEARRGKIFGRVQSALLLGSFLTTIVVVPMAGRRVIGFQGWRVAFLLVALLSAGVSALVLALMPEPPHTEAKAAAQGGWAAAVDELRTLLRFFRLPTFCIMIMQGIFGTIPWTVMGNLANYFQLSGVPDWQAGLLTGAMPICGAMGNILGGFVSDLLAAGLRLNGRPLSAQISVALGIPCIFFILYGIAPGEGSFWTYMALIVAFGILGSWAQSGTNFPILSHIVPASCRSRVMAWECALENSSASALGPLLVGVLALDCFGYDFGQKHKGGIDLGSARALGKAMTATICIPWLVTFAAYGLLHWSYPRDVRLLQQEEKKEGQAELQGPRGQCEVEDVTDAVV